MPVDAPRSNVWEVLVEMIEHPDRFLENVGRVHIRARGDDFVERVMHVASSDDRETLVHERITWDATAGTVIGTLLDDPIYTGTITNAILGADGDLALAFTLAWKPRDGTEPVGGPDWETELRDALEEVKAAAEAF